MSNPPRIAIIGAGIAALTLGRVLQLKNIPFTIFERDSSVFGREQGGTLDLHSDSGQIAIRKAELHDQWRAHMRVSGQAMKMIAKDGTVVLDHGAKENDESRPEIDRGDLRKIFLDVLDGDRVKWNTQVTSITKLQSGGFELGFSNGTIQAFDLVVGADGCHSVIRSAVTSVRPGYTGVTFCETWMVDAAKNHPKEAALVGPGTLLALNDGKGIIAQVNSDEKIRVYSVLSVPEYWSRQVEKVYDWSNPESGAKERLVEEFFADWCPELRSLISGCSNKSGVWPRPIYYLPIDHRWDHVPGVTLIGDAVHVMSPFAGAGANTAMLDGALLGEAIAEGLQVSSGGGDALETRIQEFEQEMFKRASKSATESDTNLRSAMKPDGVYGVASTIKALIEAGEAQRSVKR